MTSFEEEIANNLIDLAIENEWCDIERIDVEWILEEEIDNILQIIDKKTATDESGTIIRRQ